jgi:hypothetical protein
VEIRTVCVSNRIVEGNSCTDFWVPPPPSELAQLSPRRQIFVYSFRLIFNLYSPNHRYLRGFDTVATSTYLDCWPFNRTTLCLKWRGLSNCIPRCLLAEQLDTKSVRMLLGITAARCISYDSALLFSTFICHSFAFWSSLIFGEGWGGDWCPDGIVLGLNCF